MAQKGALGNAYSAMRKGKFDVAIARLSRAESYTTPSRSMAAEISFLRAQCYELSGRPSEVIAIYTYTAEKFPETVHGAMARNVVKNFR